jgi:hypothetical protein
MVYIGTAVRRRVPLLKIVSLRTMLSKLRVAKLQLILAEIMHLVVPLTVRRSAAHDKAHPVDDTIMQRNVNVNQLKASYY